MKLSHVGDITSSGDVSATGGIRTKASRDRRTGWKLRLFLSRQSAYTTGAAYVPERCRFRHGLSIMSWRGYTPPLWGLVVCNIDCRHYGLLGRPTLSWHLSEIADRGALPHLSTSWLKYVKEVVTRTTIHRSHVADKAHSHACTSDERASKVQKTLIKRTVVSNRLMRRKPSTLLALSWISK